MNITELHDALGTGTVDQIKNIRQNRFTHLLVLREVTSTSRFTTDGETTNTQVIMTGDPERETLPMKAVDLFYRKQPGAERRRAKEIQRDLMKHVQECATDLMGPNDMNSESIESVLFGSAAGNDSVSQRSRVLYNSAFSIRDSEVAAKQEKQNAPGDQARNDSEEGQGLWTHGFVEPHVLFPSVVTLDSATPEEVMFTMAVINKTARYGAATSRGGCVNNHILGAYCGTNDSPANMRVTQMTTALLADELSDNDSYTLDDLKSIVTGLPIRRKAASAAMKEAFELLDEEDNLNLTEIPQEELSEAERQLNDDGVLAGILEDQYEKVETYIDSFEN